MGAQRPGWGPKGNNRAPPEGVPQCTPGEAEGAVAVHGKAAFIVQETRKLEVAGVIREVRYPEWLAKPIVPKKGGKEHMCVDFTNLNKA